MLQIDMENVTILDRKIHAQEINKGWSIGHFQKNGKRLSINTIQLVNDLPFYHMTKLVII